MRRGLRPCSTPGCKNTTDARQAQCQQCRAVSDAVHVKPFYATERWKHARRVQLLRQPWCCVCGARADTVDHIDGNRDNVAPSNLRSMCARHHRARTGRDQPGGARLP